MKETEENLNSWKTVLEVLWSFSDEEFIDTYCYRLVEFLPECILESDTYDDDWEYVTPELFTELYTLYSSCKCIADIQYIMNLIQDMVGVHLYSKVYPPATESLRILEQQLLPFLQAHVKQLPEIEAFRIFSIHKDQCWDRYHKKEEIQFLRNEQKQ